ncbi:MAG: hypothetical protein WBK20_04710 [Spirochaetota bacterium]
MKIKKYRMEQLEEARKIQKDCLKNHLPCPPVTWWMARILDKNGEIEEQIESKCNSYTRNGLNLIAQHSMYITQPYRRDYNTFEDGVISYRYSNKSDGPGSGTCIYVEGSTQLVIGNGSAPENLDAIQLSNNITASTTPSSATFSTVFDAETRKLHTAIQRCFKNNTESPISVTETGVEIKLGEISNGAYPFFTIRDNALVVRDVLENPIEIPASKTLLFTYNFELLYPE